MHRNQEDNDVTVIIPTYSRVESTVTAIESALRQTIKPRYIYVIDDGSAQLIFEELRKRIDETKVTLIKGDRSAHPGITRNVGLSIASTRWIAFLDSDDYWIETKLEQQLKYARQNSARAVCTNAFIDENKLSLGLHNRIPKNISTKALIKKNLIINSSVLIDRNLLLSVGGVSSEYSVRGVEDYATWLKVSKYAIWHGMNENLLFYHSESPDSIRKSGNGNDFSHVNAWLDFASWSKDRNISNQIFIRIALRLLGRLIGI
jgi:teichuronic acid biosynthesis glycosyltransferase TuaG